MRAGRHSLLGMQSRFAAHTALLAVGMVQRPGCSCLVDHSLRPGRPEAVVGNLVDSYPMDSLLVALSLCGG
jgi:hypothetical protein